MEVLCQWIQENLEAQHPIVTAAITHFNMARIHPFDDGNGRGARLLMNLILMKRGYPPAIIKREKRRQYLETLRQADKGNLKGFVELIAYSLLHTQQVILADCKV
ncbi:MAG: Fic family protein [bacterium]|nr:Fic family protein [bacterium]